MLTLSKDKSIFIKLPDNSVIEIEYNSDYNSVQIDNRPAKGVDSLDGVCALT